MSDLVRISEYTACRVFMKFGIGVVYKGNRACAMNVGSVAVIMYLWRKWVSARTLHISATIWMKFKKEDLRIMLFNYCEFR